VLSRFAWKASFYNVSAGYNKDYPLLTFLRINDSLHADPIKGKPYGKDSQIANSV